MNLRVKDAYLTAVQDSHNTVWGFLVTESQCLFCHFPSNTQTQTQKSQSKLHTPLTAEQNYFFLSFQFFS